MLKTIGLVFGLVLPEALGLLLGTGRHKKSNNAKAGMQVISAWSTPVGFCQTYLNDEGDVGQGHPPQAPTGPVIMRSHGQLIQLTACIAPRRFQHTWASSKCSLSCMPGVSVSAWPHGSLFCKRWAVRPHAVQTSCKGPLMMT